MPTFTDVVRTEKAVHSSQLTELVVVWQLVR